MDASIHNKPKLLIAVSFVHEMINAEIYRKMLPAAQLGNLTTPNMTTKQQINYVKNLRNNFPGLYDYYVKRWRIDWGHQMMAQHYVDIIKNAIAEYDTNAYTSETYEAIAWLGLYGTIAWNNLSPSKQTTLKPIIILLCEMKRILVISIFILFNIQFLNSQEIKKEKVYLLYNDYIDNCKYSFLKGRLKLLKKEGLQLNLCGKVFLHKKGMRKDTLCLWYLKDYKITETENLKSLEKEWRKKNEEALKKRYILYKQIDRNGVFDIDIIEKINDSQMVIYQAEFRNEGVVK